MLSRLGSESIEAQGDVNKKHIRRLENVAASE